MVGSDGASRPREAGGAESQATGGRRSRESERQRRGHLDAVQPSSASPCSRPGPARAGACACYSGGLGKGRRGQAGGLGVLAQPRGHLWGAQRPWQQPAGPAAWGVTVVCARTMTELIPGAASGQLAGLDAALSDLRLPSGLAGRSVCLHPGGQRHPLPRKGPVCGRQERAGAGRGDTELREILGWQAAESTAMASGENFPAPRRFAGGAPTRPRRRPRRPQSLWNA